MLEKKETEMWKKIWREKDKKKYFYGDLSDDDINLIMIIVEVLNQVEGGGDGMIGSCLPPPLLSPGSFVSTQMENSILATFKMMRAVI